MAQTRLSLRRCAVNDYIGYRPVATLESQKIEPYQHEWIRPDPLFIKGSGVAVGRYHDVVAECIDYWKVPIRSY